MKNNTKKKRFSIWVSIFVVLFLFNILVEAVLLPWWGLDNTPKNDLYFKIWWAVVALWLLFGLPLLNAFGKKDSR